MEQNEFLKMYELEQSHWWFVGKRNLIKNILNRHIFDKNILYKFTKINKLKLLDIGCGTGIILQLFNNYGNAYGLDISTTALNFCEKRGLNNLKKARVEKLPFPNNYFDVIGCFDVLYHKDVKDYKKALKEIYRILKPEGLIIITDAAFNFLKSKHDIALGTGRRFNKKSFSKIMKRTGFKIKKISYYNMFLFLIVLIKRKIIDKFSKNTDNINSDIKKTNKFINNILISLLNFESRLIKKISLPFGVSILCVAKK